jgi:hypothetical protein
MVVAWRCGLIIDCGMYMYSAIVVHCAAKMCCNQTMLLDDIAGGFLI